MSRSWAGGSSRGWRKVRAAVLARDGYLCQVRRPDVCTTIATHAHHTIGRSITGDDPAHIVAACGPCNLAVGDPTAQPDPPHRPATRW